MATSGTISATTFNTLKVVDSAFRRCRIASQDIAPEMQNNAIDALYLLLSELANEKTPSWCIEKIILPMYSNTQIVALPTGTVSVLNLNYRTTQEVTGTITTSATSYSTEFSDATTVSTVGVQWTSDSQNLVVECSDDGTTWVQVGVIEVTAQSGVKTWVDIEGAQSYLHIRITSSLTLNVEDVYFGNSPQEIPLGILNRDQYVNQNNKIFPSRPNTYWFQRDLPVPVVNLWPAPNLAATSAQLVCWRHRHIMDVGTLRQEIEVPQRWLDAIINSLASKIGQESPRVDLALLPMLESKAATSVMKAWAGDNDGSPTIYQPNIAPYTR